MTKSARAIIVYHQNILLIERHRANKHYYTLPGGAIEPGETAEQALLREVREESSLIVDDFRLVYIDQMPPPFGVQYIFTASYVDGDVKLSPASIEAELNRRGKSTFQPLWLPVNKLAGLVLLPNDFKIILLQDLAAGLPKSPKMLTSKVELLYT